MYLYYGISLFFIFLTNALTSEVIKDTVQFKEDYETVSIVLEDGIMEPIILECDYPDEEENNVRSVKWFKDNNLMYQWIPGRDPIIMQNFTKLENSNFQIATIPQKQNSSIALINPTIGTSGHYKCVVGALSEAYFTYKRLQIIDVRNYTFNMVHRKIQNETQLECIVKNVFPKPTLYISSDDDDIINVISESAFEIEDGYFNATISGATYDDDEDPDDYKCTISFDGYKLNLTTTVSSNNVASFVIGNSISFPFIVSVFIWLYSLL